MSKNKERSTKEYVCKNCDTNFVGNYCPECGQSIKEFERPFQFLIIDFMGNMFAFDTRFWKTFVAILFKPGTLALDYVKGHRVRYMPPFRFYVFISFIFFLLLNLYTSRYTKSMEKSNFIIFESSNIDEKPLVSDSINIDSLALKAPIEKDNLQAKKDFLNEHPDIFVKQLLNNVSWGMFLLMPFYAFLLWLFYRKKQRYYITHFIMAINQHAFMFVVLIIMLTLSLIADDFTKPFRNFLLLLIPIYIIIGHKILYKQKTIKAIFKFLAIVFIYSIVVFAFSIGMILLVVTQNGIAF